MVEAVQDIPRSQRPPVIGRIEVYASALKGAHGGQVFHSSERWYTRESTSFTDANWREAYWCHEGLTRQSTGDPTLTGYRPGWKRQRKKEKTTFFLLPPSSG